MTADEKNRLLEAARRAYLDGWHRWELPGQVRAAAKAYGIDCSPAAAQDIAAIA